MKKEPMFQYAKGFDEGRASAFKQMREKVLEVNSWYPISIFTEPKPGSPPDCYSAAMARHLCDLLIKFIDNPNKEED